MAVYAVDGDRQDHLLNRLDVLLVELPNDLDPLSMIPKPKMHREKKLFELKKNNVKFHANHVQLNVSLMRFLFSYFDHSRNSSIYELTICHSIIH